jgi:uncharacterized protein YgiM (DUF1202 family)
VEIKQRKKLNTRRFAVRVLAAALCLLLAGVALPLRGALAESTLATGYVNTAKLNLRKGAGTGNAIVDTLAKSTAVNIYEVVGTWLRIDVPSTGKSGYVSGKYNTVNLPALRPMRSRNKRRVNLKNRRQAQATVLAL